MAPHCVLDKVQAPGTWPSSHPDPPTMPSPNLPCCWSITRFSMWWNQALSLCLHLQSLCFPSLHSTFFIQNEVMNQMFRLDRGHKAKRGQLFGWKWRSVGWRSRCVSRANRRGINWKSRRLGSNIDIPEFRISKVEQEPWVWMEVLG